MSIIIINNINYVIHYCYKVYVLEYISLRVKELCYADKKVRSYSSRDTQSQPDTRHWPLRTYCCPSLKPCCGMPIGRHWVWMDLGSDKNE